MRNAAIERKTNETDISAEMTWIFRGRSSTRQRA